MCYFPLFDGDKGGGAEFRYVSHPILWSCWHERPSQWHNAVAKNLQHEDLSIPITLSLWSLRSSNGRLDFRGPTQEAS